MNTYHVPAPFDFAPTMQAGRFEYIPVRITTSGNTVRVVCAAGVDCSIRPYLTRDDNRPETIAWARAFVDASTMECYEGQAFQVVPVTYGETTEWFHFPRNTHDKAPWILSGWETDDPQCPHHIALKVLRDSHSHVVPVSHAFRYECARFSCDTMREVAQSLRLADYVARRS